MEDPKKLQILKPVAVVRKNQRDPFLDFKPTPWKRPYYFMEDLLEKSLAKTEALSFTVHDFAEKKKVNVLLVAYIGFSTIVALTLASAAIRKVGFFF